MNGAKTPDWDAFAAVKADLPVQRVMAYSVLRGDQVLEVGGPQLDAPIVGSVAIRSAALDAGLQEGDVILTMDGQEIGTFLQLRGIVQGSGGKPLPMTIWRDGNTFELSLTPRVRTVEDENGVLVDRYLIGIVSGLVVRVRGPPNVGVWEALSLGRLWQMADDDRDHVQRAEPDGDGHDQQLRPFGGDRHGPEASATRRGSGLIAFDLPDAGIVAGYGGDEPVSDSGPGRGASGVSRL